MEPKASVDFVDLARHLCEMVVTQPDAVEVVHAGGSHTVIITATVSSEDIGRVIGKQGATIKAIRYLLEQAGRRVKQKVYFELANKQANWTAEEGSPSEDAGPQDENAESE